MKFTNFNLNQTIIESLERNNLIRPTKIQELSIPKILENKDFIGLSKTGSGKTLAYILPTLEKILTNKEKGSLKALILAPTKELVIQIQETLKKIIKDLDITSTAIYGVKQEKEKINLNVNILISTPIKLINLIKEKEITLLNLETIIFDEVDELIKMDFLTPQNKKLLKLPKESQKLFFSATMSNNIKKLALEILNEPQIIEIKEEKTIPKNITHEVLFVDEHNKNDLLLNLLLDKELKQTLIFTTTKLQADQINRFLVEEEIESVAIHSGKSLFHREKALSNFKNKIKKVLIATDLMARGIDIENITHVINYDIPNEPQNYVHRVGRVGRGIKKGVAFSLCSSKDRLFLEKIKEEFKLHIPTKTHNFHSTKAKSIIEAKKAKPKGKTVNSKNSFLKKPKKKDKVKKSGRSLKKDF